MGEGKGQIRKVRQKEIERERGRKEETEKREAKRETGRKERY